MIIILQHQPPPIDYQQRRTTGKNTQLLADAVDTARRRHPTRQDQLTLTRLLWEKFTGSDITYAPNHYNSTPAHPAHTVFRRLQPVRYADLLHSAPPPPPTHPHRRSRALELGTSSTTAQGSTPRHRLSLA